METPLRRGPPLLPRRLLDSPFSLGVQFFVSRGLIRLFRFFSYTAHASFLPFSPMFSRNEKARPPLAYLLWGMTFFPSPSRLFSNPRRSGTVLSSPCRMSKNYFPFRFWREEQTSPPPALQFFSATKIATRPPLIGVGLFSLQLKSLSENPFPPFFPLPAENPNFPMA